MDFFEDNYFDIIALPSTDESMCIQPSDYIPQYQQYEGLNSNDDELPSYTELTNSFIPSSISTSSELEQFLIFDCDDSYSVTTFDNLPDQTLMCTDSCSAFIKESSEILRVNSLKIQQQDEVSMSSVEEVVKNVKNDDKIFFTCNFGDCTKTYSKPAHLRAHLRRHLGLKPYLCNFPNCQWKFSRSDELARHQRSHSGIKPYKCFYCSKTFSRSDHLRKHVRIHEKKLSGSKLKFIWDEIPKQKPGRKKKILTTPQQ
ncbi:hypothetical protein PVAND_000362 [Polypedilum vanderplanki]|uniref:C2H2-type domain-containing protein n=1 Tax=Polypedilum vanderplanki TaxID=319348 RepID=A0A9J6BJR8_POLVA|nr:hypothetical protein PVAND_000362 [Polypedilum vanderplanki]